MDFQLRKSDLSIHCASPPAGASKLADLHAPDLLHCDEPRLLQDADVLRHARECHVALFGKLRDRGVSCFLRSDYKDRTEVRATSLQGRTRLLGRALFPATTPFNNSA